MCRDEFKAACDLLQRERRQDRSTDSQTTVASILAYVPHPHSSSQTDSPLFRTRRLCRVCHPVLDAIFKSDSTAQLHRTHQSARPAGPALGMLPRESRAGSKARVGFPACNPAPRLVCPFAPGGVTRPCREAHFQALVGMGGLPRHPQKFPGCPATLRRVVCARPCRGARGMGGLPPIVIPQLPCHFKWQLAAGKPARALNPDQ